ncbi:prepilin peptidase [Mycobacterium sp. PS03-16]|uniref:prepilin peptidase n=1 Tax=Mycobacterium sp. PS03-16 TaxID=2559611 RepID=UPI00107370E4|nr:A24 family peptidase [Mycobacterium sp. PS03-16]TFV58886.1 prepilin peptidase [Mycobacterium sp. PS03-16]
MGELLAGACVAAWLIALSLYDIRRRRLPNWLTLPGAVAILLAAALTGHGLPALAGAAALFAIYAVIHLTRPAAMGAGDAKLALGLGALTGAFGVDIWLLAALAGPLVTALWALVPAATGPGRTVPHGPSMCLASVAAVALMWW